jgi:Leucine-rich repeat (LRR) protein
MFPNLSMLDLSNNQLKDIPPVIHELTSLSVLNVSGNKGNIREFFFLVSEII